MGLLVDAGGQELLELGALLVQDPQRGVARAGDLPRRLKHTIENHAEVELGHELTPDIKQPANPRVPRGELLMPLEELSPSLIDAVRRLGRNPWRPAPRRRRRHP